MGDPVAQIANRFKTAPGRSHVIDHWLWVLNDPSKPDISHRFAFEALDNLGYVIQPGDLSGKAARMHENRPRTA